MRILTGILLMSLLVSGSPALIKNTAASGKAKAEQAGPTILKRTITVNVRRFLRWWKNPKAAEPVYNTYSWVPKINFQVLGPIAGGSQFYVEFDTPDGKPWLKYDMTTPELEADYFDDIKMKDINNDELEKKAITTPAGIFPFRIKLKNALEGKDDVVFAGKYKVSTYAPNQSIPDYKGKQEFYVDHDWRLPISYLWLDPTKNEDAPILSVQVWFKGEISSSKLQAYIFYNGRQMKMNVFGNPVEEVYSAADEPPFKYTLWQFSAYMIRGSNQDTLYNNYPDAMFLNKNPGEYEIKILRDNQLARTAKFTVGQDGKFVDNGFAKNAKLGGARMILPVKITGAGDGKWNMTSYQTEAFYGNPLNGFVAP